MTSQTPPKSTYSPAEGFGQSPQDLPDGQTTAPSGQPVARASRSAKQVKVAVLMMNGICGQTWIDSSLKHQPLANDRLLSWENRLRENLAMIGSTESALIWKSKDTGHGWSISRLAPWTPPTSDKGSTGSRWPTVKVSTGGADPESRETGKSLQAVMPHMPTPTVADVQGGRKHRSGARSNEPLLNGIMASWGTPQASDVRKHSENPRTVERRIAKGQQIALNAFVALTMDQLPRQMVATWGTPLANPSNGTPEASLERKRKSVARGNSMGIVLTDCALQMAATWRSPQANSGGGGDTHTIEQIETMLGKGQSIKLQDQIVQVSGQITNGSPATTAKRGAPNPVFACWLMGFPDAWVSGALLAMQSMPSSRRKSSKPSSKPMDDYLQ
ncbi:MAG: hypothetical protein ABJA10_10030 [Aestuariivirga sp.]